MLIKITAPRTNIELEAFSLSAVTENVSRYISNHRAPERIVVLTQAGKAFLDWGSICYPGRGISRARADWRCHDVDPTRQKILISIYEVCLEKLANGQSPWTIWSKLSYGYRVFEWLDNCCAYELSRNTVERALSDYCLHRDQECVRGNISTSKAAREQASAKSVLAWAFNRPENEISKQCISTPHITTPTDAPEAESVHTAGALSEAIFTQLTDFLISAMDYPFQLSLPSEDVWVLPTTMWCLTENKKRSIIGRPNQNKKWDYEKGQIKSSREIQVAYGCGASTARQYHTRATKQLTDANNDPYNSHRWKLAAWATAAFQYLFISVTGINPSPMALIPWTSDSRLQSERQGFRSYKDRAAKVVYFEITAKFLPLFAKFLKLREFILQGRPWPYLFFSIKKDHQPKELFDQSLYLYFDQIKQTLAYDLTPVNARELRQFKGSETTEKYGNEIGAVLLQNTNYVTDRHYTSGNEKKQGVELTDYWNTLKIVVKDITLPVSQEDRTPTGSCSNSRSPSVKSDSLPTPICGTFLTCIYCENLLLHNDEEDIWKLLSTKQYVRLLNNYPNISSIAPEILTRAESDIEDILSRLSRIDEGTSELVAEVRRKTEDGFLHSYWQELINLTHNLIKLL